MKRIIFTCLVFLISITTRSQSVAITSDGTAPNASAMLDVKSTTKGVLIPRMTTAQRIAIKNAAEGLLVYDMETLNLWVYKDAGWSEIRTDAGGGTAAYWAATGNNIYNSNTGYVGIGTTNPRSLLTLQTGYNSTGYTHIGLPATGTDSIIYSEGVGGVSAAIGTSSNHALRFVTNGTGKLSIYPQGEVVIGDNNVGSIGKLTVKTTNNADGISHIGDNGNILKTIMGGTSAGFGTFSPTHMRIFCNSRSDIFIASATGNVGIGRENFSANKLEVNGTIRSKEVIVENINWADYVFDEKYKLTPLNELEKYIEKNKHLPNIPSSKEIEKNGLHLSDTQKQMMEKIEELTLYMIDANKQLKEAVNEIDILKLKLTELQSSKSRH